MSTLLTSIAAMLRPYAVKIAMTLWKMCFEMIIDALEHLLITKLAEARSNGAPGYRTQPA